MSDYVDSKFSTGGFITSKSPRPDHRTNLAPNPSFSTENVSIPLGWLTAILKSLGGSVVIDQYQMFDAQEKHYRIEMLKTADPPTWIMRLGERLDD